MIHKLAYEWKNIYRQLSAIDQKGLGVVTLSEFLTVCDKVNVSIIPLEVVQLMKLYGIINDSELEKLGI